MPNTNDEKQIKLLRQRILLACADKLGGIDQLARYVAVSQEQVSEWIAGKTVAPISIVLRAIDPVIGEREPVSADNPQEEPPKPIQ